MGLVVVVVRGRVFTSGGWVSCMLLKADHHPCSSSPSSTECARLIRYITVGTVNHGWPLWHPPTWWCGPPSLHALITTFLTPVHTWMSELCSQLGRSSCFLQCICNRCYVCARLFTIFINQANLCAFKLRLRYQYIFGSLFSSFCPVFKLLHQAARLIAVVVYALVHYRNFA